MRVDSSEGRPNAYGDVRHSVYSSLLYGHQHDEQIPLLERDLSEELSVTLHDVQIIEIVCRSMSLELLLREIDAFFFDFVDDQPDQDAWIDLSILPPAHAEVLFSGLSEVWRERGYRFGVVFLDSLSDYTGSIVPLNLPPFRQFSRHLLGGIAYEELPPELRDYKFSAGLGL
jgi:hypothetical protein